MAEKRLLLLLVVDCHLLLFIVDLLLHCYYVTYSSVGFETNIYHYVFVHLRHFWRDCVFATFVCLSVCFQDNFRKFGSVGEFG